MIDKLLFEYKRKNKIKSSTKTKSHSLSKKTKINEKNFSEKKTKHNLLNKNLNKRNILFNNQQSKINLKSTSTSSLSSSAEKKYLTPTKYNMQNYENDYYFNENYNKTQELFNISNISRPKLDYNVGRKKNKNILLTVGTRLSSVSNNDFSSNYGRSRVLMINKSFKSNKYKNKYVICRKNDISNMNRVNYSDNTDSDSKSVETYHNNRKNESVENNCEYLNNNNCFNKDKNIFNEFNCNYSANKEIRFSHDNDNENEIKLENLENFNKKRKYKNIVLRPHKIQKENLLKHNIKVNNNCEIDDSPKIINKIMTRLNIKPKNSRVFKYQ